MADSFRSSTKIILNLAEENILGRGSFGVVYKGRFARMDVAVKVINLHLRPRYQTKLENETVTFRKSLKHHNIVDVYSVEEKAPYLWIAMELCDESLQSYVEKQSLEDTEILDILLQCSQGLLFLHDNGLIHRDIKPDNFLVKMSESDDLTMKVTDFSLAKDMSGLIGSEETSVHGNRHWLAPELFDEDGRKLSNIRFKGKTIQKLDVFSFALLILYTCVTADGRKLLQQEYEIGVKVKHGISVIGLFEDCWRSEYLRYLVTPLVRRMLELEPAARPSMAEVHEAFTSKDMSPRLQHITSRTLGFKANANVGISRYNDILLGSSRGLHLYRLLHWASFGAVWQKTYPTNVGRVDRKCVFGKRLYTRNIKGNKVTHSWSVSLRDHQTHKAGSGHVLIGILDLEMSVKGKIQVGCIPTIIYRKSVGKGYELVGYKQNTRTLTLKPPKGNVWSDKGLSVCQHPTEGWIVVCDSRTLSVYSEKGVYLHSAGRELGFRAGSRHALACTENLIVLRRVHSAWLYMYSWSGRKMKEVDVRRKLKLDSKEVVWALGGGGEGRKVTLAVGDRSQHVTSIHACRLD